MMKTDESVLKSMTRVNLIKNRQLYRVRDRTQINRKEKTLLCEREVIQMTHVALA